MSDAGRRRLVITEHAERDLRRLSARDQGRLRVALDGLTQRPPAGDIKKLHGATQQWRLRVGDWRVRFTIVSAGQTVEILRVLPRGRAYRN